MDKKIATFIGDVNPTARGKQKLYRCSPQLDGFEYVVVSALVLPVGLGTETYIFGSDNFGNIVEWGELSGSMKGTLLHEEALRNAGYEIGYKEVPNE